MPVIINDFEVVAETPSTPSAEGAAGAPREEPAPAPALSPQDLWDLHDHQAERAARLYAG